ncbi:MAG: ABC transporter ATP-binding protein/permease [Actinomycetia bacterium]|nr:ABC transporter ATP-binding protein/permease [Actinomycetes bacterium]
MNTDLLRSLRFMRRYRTVAVTAVVAVLAASAADLVAPQLLRHIVDQGITAGHTNVIASDALWLVMVATVGGIAQFLQGYLSGKASHGAAYDMREAIFERLQTLSFSYHDRVQTGQLITRVTSDVDLVRDFVGGGLVQAIAAAILLVGAVVLVTLMNWQLALVAFTAIPLTIFVLVRFVSGLSPMYRSFQQRLAALNSVLQENVAGIRVVKAFAREPYEAERYRAANESLLDQGLQVRRNVANAFPLLFSVGNLGVALVVWVGAVKVAHGTLTVGELVAFTSYLMILLQPLFILGFGAQTIARAGASATRLFEVLDAETDVPERPGAIVLTGAEGRVEFRDVHLRYPGSDAETLAGVSFVVEPGTTVALVGSTGSGKTSVVNLVPRFYDVTGGAVLLDGHDVRDITLASLRGVIGVVMQDSVLFSGTIAQNIAYGKPEATREAIRQAAEAAQADAFVMQLPEGYDTRVGERGIRLSGGQRQRIAIARALLIDPRVLIMDDSTSSVDAETEAALRVSLDLLIGGRTTFIVAQRLSTVKRADTILVIEDGTIAARGTHEELLATSCVYAEIAASQLAGGEEIERPGACDLEGE